MFTKKDRDMLAALYKWMLDSKAAEKVLNEAAKQVMTDRRREGR